VSHGILLATGGAFDCPSSIVLIHQRRVLQPEFLHQNRYTRGRKYYLQFLLDGRRTGARQRSALPDDCDGIRWTKCPWRMILPRWRPAHVCCPSGHDPLIQLLLSSIKGGAIQFS